MPKLEMDLTEYKHIETERDSALKRVSELESKLGILEDEVPGIVTTNIKVTGSVEINTHALVKDFLKQAAYNNDLMFSESITLWEMATWLKNAFRDVLEEKGIGSTTTDMAVSATNHIEQTNKEYVRFSAIKDEVTKELSDEIVKKNNELEKAMEELKKSTKNEIVEHTKSCKIQIVEAEKKCAAKILESQKELEEFKAANAPTEHKAQLKQMQENCDELIESQEKLYKALESEKNGLIEERNDLVSQLRLAKDKPKIKFFRRIINAILNR